MNKRYFTCSMIKKYTLLLGLLLVFSCQNVFGQSTNSILYLSVNKNLMVVGETIDVKLFYNHYLQDTMPVSYVYCDLVGQDGVVYAGSKLRLDKQSADFQIEIPSFLLSGNYLLRAYAPSMRNNPFLYAMSWIRIINSKTSDILAIKTDGANALIIDALSQSNKIKISGLADSYNKRALIDCKLLLDSNLIYPSLSISVVKKEAYLPQQISLIRNTTYNNDKQIVTSNSDALFISGHLEAEKGSTINSLSRQRVYCSIRGSHDIFSTITDSVGYFSIKLPDMYDKHDVFITTEKMNNNVRILIDRDFDNQTVYKWNKDFYLTKEELDCALKTAQNLAVLQSFSPKMVKDSSVNNLRSFYGNPDEVIIINDYIDLGGLSMYFTELPGNVHLHKKDNHYEARIINPQYTQLYQEPLIMVDYVVVNDLNEVLKMDAKKVNRIEIVRDYYFKGGASFGGILNFITNNNDFGGYGFSPSSISMSYDFLAVLSENNTDSISTDSKPDARNTLLWKPNVVVKNNEVKLNFYTADSPGKYLLIVKGIDKNGQQVFYSANFEVKK